MDIAEQLEKLKSQRIAGSWYLKDPEEVAQNLLGKVLVSHLDKELTSGRIVEVELYSAPEDKASHAFNNRKTSRTEVLFKTGGFAYVHMTHQQTMLNVVISDENIPRGVLIRALEPLVGIDQMIQRRGKQALKDLTSGPGKLCQALGITKSLYATDLTNSDILWIASDHFNYNKDQIAQTVRVGIDYAEEYALKPWRYIIKNSLYLSKRYNPHNDI